MSQHEHDERSAERRSGEGVRIIGAEEAQAALEAGAAAGRRSDDELRFGDVPPAPSGPRPPHRFPLPDSVDPAEAVPRPPVVVPPRQEPQGAARGRGPSPEAAHDPTPWTERGTGRAWGTVPAGATVPADDEPTEALPRTAAGEGDADEGPSGGDRPATEAADDNTGEPAGAGAVPPVAVPPAAVPPVAVPPATGSHAAEPPTAELTVTPAPDRPTALTPTPMPPTPTPPPAEDSPWTSRPSAPAPSSGTAARQPPATPADPTDVWATRAPAPRPPAGGGAAAPAAPADALPPTASPADALPPPTTAGGDAPASPPPAASAPLPPDAPAHRPPDEGMPVTGGFGTDLPHWTDPPTGEVPRIRPEQDTGGEDDLAAWAALGSRSTVWRDDTTGWQQPVELADLAEEGRPEGVFDSGRSEASDLYSFDEDFERLEEERSGAHRAIRIGDRDAPGEAGEPPEAAPSGATRVGVRPGRPSRSGRPGRPGAGGGASDLGSRVGVGLGLVVALLVAWAIGPVALLLLALAVVTAAAAEVYGILRPSGFRPATLLGLCGTVGLVLATYWRGPDAIPLVTAIVFVASMLWYLLGVVDARPLVNVAVTMTAFVWVGVLGSYAGLLLRAHHGRGLFLGAVVPAVAADIVAYFAGRRVGSRLLAPSVSPAKTVEGAVAGGVAAIVIGLVVGHSLSPWGGLKHGLLLGVVVAVLAPIGDLFESMVKRDLSIKDTGSVLPGHGGVLDRFDSVLLVLPAAYYLAVHFGVAG